MRRAAFAVVGFLIMKTAKGKSNTKACSAKAPASKGGVPSVSESGEVVKFNEADMPKIDVWLEDETIWLTQKQMGLLFGVMEHTITYHIQEITKSGELEGLATTRKIRVVRLEGKRNVSRFIDFYNLDMIISVGYRVNSRRGVLFRRWATGVLKEYLLRGLVRDQRIGKLEKRMPAARVANPCKIGLSWGPQAYDETPLRYSRMEMPKRLLNSAFGGVGFSHPQAAVISDIGSFVCRSRRFTSSSRIRSIAS